MDHAGRRSRGAQPLEGRRRRPEAAASLAGLVGSPALANSVHTPSSLQIERARLSSSIAASSSSGRIPSRVAPVSIFR